MPHRSVTAFLIINLLCQYVRGMSHSLRDDTAESSIDSSHEHVVGSDTKTHIFREFAASITSRHDIVKKDRASSDHMHEVMFAVQQKNMPELTRFLHDVSDPKSEIYGEHMTRQEVEDFTSSTESREAICKFLDDAGVTIVSESVHGEYITASAPIKLWETAFSTEFFTYHHTAAESEIATQIVRAERYSVPLELHEHVASVFHTIQMPMIIWGHPIKRRIKNYNTTGTIRANAVTGFASPLLLNSVYNINSNLGNALSTQAVFSTIGQYFNDYDLRQFQQMFSIPPDGLAVKIGGHIDDSNTICKANSDSCTEANLDVQYLKGVSQISPTTHWYTDANSFAAWLLSVANMARPPKVFSISYGANEASVSRSEFDAFNVQAIKLGAMGITIVASSGGNTLCRHQFKLLAHDFIIKVTHLCCCYDTVEIDDGATSYEARGDNTKCAYKPLFPASSPYVTAVGATQV